MVSYCNRSRSVKVKAPPKVVYAPKASSVVLSPEARMNLAQFCMLLMTIDKQIKSQQRDQSYDKPEQTYTSKIKGSLINGPYYLNSFLYKNKLIPPATVTNIVIIAIFNFSAVVFPPYV